MRRRQSSTRGQADPAADAPPPAKRSLGQNFLVDPAAVARIVAAIGAGPGVDVVEIGPGRGALTEAILAAGARVVAIEIDRTLGERLRARLDAGRFRLVESDVLDVPLASLGTGLVLAGNLPYNISKPIAMKLVEERRAVARAVLMFQREVAGRLTARPGSKEYGPLTVLAGRAFRIEALFHLPAGAFRPAPKVVSTVTRWIPRPAADLPDDLVPPLKSLLRTAFAHRRQTLLKNLRGVSGGDLAARRALAEAGIDGGVRAEAVTPEEFIRLAHIIRGAP